MDVVLIIVCGTLVLCFLVFIHEGGHFLAARACGVRVTEFMLGLPGPSVGFTHGGTRFGITAVPLGGYARICGMEGGEVNPYAKPALAALYARGTANMEDIARDCGCTDEEAYEALEELAEWGGVVRPHKKDAYNTYRTPRMKPTKRQLKRLQAAVDLTPTQRMLLEAREEGLPCPVPSADELYEAEYAQQYRAQPFWKRSVILLAGVTVNLLFALLAIVIIYSVIGFDYALEDGEVHHYLMPVWRSLQAGCIYIGMVVQAVVNLLNPATFSDTVSNSTSVVGIAIMSRDAFAQGAVTVLEFTAMISVSLGIMNLLPIPPLDGGRFVVEVWQKVSRRLVSTRAINALSLAGTAAFLLLFVVMLNQDVQRVITGFWG